MQQPLTSAVGGASIGARHRDRSGNDVRQYGMATAMTGAVRLKEGELWMNSGVLLYNAENSKESVCGMTSYRGRQHTLMPIESITHTDVVHVTKQHPTLLALSGLSLVTGIWFKCNGAEWQLVIGSFALAGLFIASFFASRRTIMTTTFSSPTKQISVTWAVEGSAEHRPTGEMSAHAGVMQDQDFDECPAYVVAWRVEQARAQILNERPLGQSNAQSVGQPTHGMAAAGPSRPASPAVSSATFNRVVGDTGLGNDDAVLAATYLQQAQDVP